MPFQKAIAKVRLLVKLQKGILKILYAFDDLS